MGRQVSGQEGKGGAEKRLRIQQFSEEDHGLLRAPGKGGRGRGNVGRGRVVPEYEGPGGGGWMQWEARASGGEGSNSPQLLSEHQT